MKPFLSIIVPVYNTAGYLERCADSIFSQGGSDVEVILVDDGSSDVSPGICDRLARDHENVCTFHQQNSGVSAARNLGIDKAHGDYLWFVDSDDRVLPGAIEKLRDACDGNVQVVNFSVVQENGTEQRLGLIPAASRSEFQDHGPLQCGDSLYPYAHVLKRSLVGSIRFDTRLALLEDRDFLYRVLIHASVPARIIKEPLYAYLITRSDSVVNTVNVERTIAAAGVQHMILLNELKKGRPEPAYTIFADYTLGTLALIARTGKCSEEFAPLRMRLISHDEYSSDLSGLMAAKYFTCKMAPAVFCFAYAIASRLQKSPSLGSGVLSNPVDKKRQPDVLFDCDMKRED